MKLNLNKFEGELSREYYLECEIIGYIFRWNDINTYLIRAYIFQDKTVVIASQLSGEVIQSIELISAVIQKLSLARKCINWISQVRLSDDHKLIVERFYKTTVKCNNRNLFPVRNAYSCHVDSEEEISLSAVEDLIEGELESIKQWCGLASDLYQQRELRRQEETNCLLQLYLQPYLELFAVEFERRKGICQAERGAVFYYPETRLENNQMALIFMPENYLKERRNYYDVLALPYINQYNPETEMVVCVRTNDDLNICGIFPKHSVTACKQMIPITFVEIAESLFPTPE